MSKAVVDVEAIFLMQVSGGTEQTKTMIAAARDAGVPRIVLLSSAGARLLPLDGPMPTALAAREQVMRGSGLGVTYLRPSYFASNTFGWRDSVRAGKVTDATGEGRLAVTDPEDIARVAVAALTDDSHVGKGYLLTGPEALTARELVQIIAEVIGRSIEFEDVTPHEFARAAVERGMLPEQAHRMERLNEVLRTRRALNITDDIQNITGTTPGTFRGWCERNADAFR